MRWRMLALLWVPVMLPAFAAQGASTPVYPERNLLQVGGDAEVAAENDSLRLLAAVVTEHKLAEEAASANAKISENVLKAFRDLKVANLKLKTEQYQVQPRYDHEARPPRIAGYRVQNTVSAVFEGEEAEKLADTATRLADAALAAGANNIQQVSFYVHDREKHEQEALRKATQSALERARVLAKAAGVRLKRIAFLSSDASAPQAVPMLRAAAMSERGAPPPFEAGESKFSAHVTLAYEIE